MADKITGTFVKHQIFNAGANCADTLYAEFAGEMPEAAWVGQMYAQALDLCNGDVVEIHAVTIQTYEDWTHIGAGHLGAVRIERPRELARETVASRTIGYSKKRGWYWKK